MVADQELNPPQRSAASDVSIKDDRRRPGRAEVDPTLIPLLRETVLLFGPLPVETAAREYAEQASFDFGTKSGLTEQAHLGDLDNDRNVGRAIMLAFLLSLPFWAVVGVICRWLLA